jgi:hypothetical protein
MNKRVAPSHAAVIGLAAWILAILTGCYGGLRLHPVTGKVQFPDGAPFAGGTVVFEPLDPAASPASGEGALKPDGTFTVRANGLGPGLYPGRYRVCVAMPEAQRDIDPNHPPEPPIERKFTDTRTSGLEFTVEAKPNDFTITVERNPKSRKKSPG